jgi:hypothetical protein
MKKLVIALLMFAVVTVNAALYNINVDTWLNDSSLHGGSATVSADGGSTWRSVYAGQFEANFVGEPYDGYPQSFTTFCTDINRYLHNGNYQPLSWSDAVNVSHNPSWTPNGDLLASSIFLTWRKIVNNNASAVGVQLAIWDALYDNGDGALSGKFRSSTDFSLYLSGPNNSLLLPAESGTWWMPTDSYGNLREDQGLMGNVVTPVPEPTTVLAGALLLIPFGLSTLRIVRSKCRK